MLPLLAALAAKAGGAMAAGGGAGGTLGGLLGGGGGAAASGGGGGLMSGMMNLGMGGGGVGKGAMPSQIPGRGTIPGGQSDAMFDKQVSSQYGNVPSKPSGQTAGGQPPPMNVDDMSQFAQGFLSKQRPIQRQASQRRQTTGPSDQYIMSLLGV